MARAHFVNRARKDYPEQGIKKGDGYWWWRFFRSTVVNRSRVQPRASQLTGSAFLSELYAIQEEIEGLAADEELQNQVEELAGRIRDLGEECQNNRDNMPEGLQDSETGQLLEARADACEAAADELEAIDLDYDKPAGADDGHDDEDTMDEDQLEAHAQAHWDRVLEELKAVSLVIE